MLDLEGFAHRTAVRMKTINYEKTASLEVLKFGLLLFINFISIVFISLSIGLITGKLTETLVTLVAFALLRACTGGYHLKSSILCIFYSSALMSIIPHVPMNLLAVYVLIIISILLILIFAPFGMENQSNIPKRFYPLLKIIGVLLVATNLFILSSTLAVCFFVQSVMLIRMKGGRVKHDEKISSN
jgi:accessory gene regulator B